METIDPIAWPTGAPSTRLSGMSDIETRSAGDARAFVEAVMALPGFASAHGFVIDTVDTGRVVLGVVPRPDLMQFTGALHGGAVAALADMAAGAAISTILPPGRIPVTIELKLNYLAPAVGDRILAEARAVPGGGAIGVAEIAVFAERPEGIRRVAIGLATMRAIPFDLPKIAPEG